MPEPADTPTADLTVRTPASRRPVRPDAVEPPPTELEGLVAELVEELEAEVSLPIPGRPGWVAVYNADIEHPLLVRWQRASRDAETLTGIDELKLSLTVLAATNVRIIRQDVGIELDGELATFRTKAFQAALGARTANDAVRKAYGRDAHAIGAANAVLAKAGYGQGVNEDPTTAS